MLYLLAGDIFEFIGTIMIAFAALRVHHRFLHEHQVDDKVFMSMKKEQRIGLIGVALLSFGFFYNLYLSATFF